MSGASGGVNGEVREAMLKAVGTIEGVGTVGIHGGASNGMKLVGHDQRRVFRGKGKRKGFGTIPGK